VNRSSGAGYGLDKLVVPGQDLGLSNLLALLRDSFSREYKGKLSAVIFTSEEEPIGVLRGCCDEEYTIESDGQQEFSPIRLTRKMEGSESQEAQTLAGTFYVVRIGEGMWVSVTIEPDEFIEKAMIRFFELCSPGISRMRYSSSEIRKLLDSFVETHELEAKVRKAITYPYGGGASIDFDNKPLVQLFDECTSGRRYLDKIRIEFFRADKSLCDAFVSRQGILRFYSGDIDFFFKKLLSLFAGVARDTKLILEKRERRMGELTASPLAIQFEEDVLVTADDNNRFVRSLSSLEKSGISVYHQNPYVHLSFLDFRDGSSCDVFAVSPRSICIVPSYRSSIESLMRLSNRILESLGEGQLSDWGEAAPDFGDFFV